MFLRSGTMKLDDVLINRYLMAVLGRDIRGNFDVSTPTGDWKDWLLNELAYRTFDVSSNGDVATTGIRLGTLSFHSVDEIHAAFCDRPWFNVQATCPWVTGALGFVSWDNYTALPREETLSLPQSLVEIGWGRVVHFEAVRDPLVRFAFPLVECTWQFGGFARGESFLSLEDRFLDDIASRINAMLPRLGVLSRVSAADRETAMRGQ